MASKDPNSVKLKNSALTQRSLQCVSNHEPKHSPPKGIKLDVSSEAIVISDTELEEGEIETELDENKEKQEDASDIPCAKIPSLTEALLGADSNNDIQDANYKLGSRYLVKDSVGESSREVFSWSDLRFLMVGDERLVGFNWKEWAEFPDQEIHYQQNANLRSLCMLVDKNLRKSHDVVVIFAFHHEFVLTETMGKSSTKNRLMDLNPQVKFSDIFETVEEFHLKWQRLFPNTNIIWTIPYPPDFLKYNSMVLKERGVDHKIKLDERKQQELSKDYFKLSRLLTKEWMEAITNIPMFPLNKLLFVKKHCYKKSFLQNGPPKFPRGFLKDGFYPTKMMASYCAYLLVELLLDKGLYPKYQVGLNWVKAEERLLEIDPEAKNYIHSGDRHLSKRPRKRSRHSRQRSYRHRRHDSISPRSSHSRSMSRSRSRKDYRSRSASKHRRRTRSRSRNRYRSRSRSRSRSSSIHGKQNYKSRIRNSNSSSVSLPSSESDSRETENNSEPSKSHKLSSLTSTSSTLNTSLKEKSVTKSDTKDNVDEEVHFWETLRYLRKVHDIECDMYRRKPESHPAYESEKMKFMKRLENSELRSVDNVNWNEFWPKRLEGVFKEKWESKKKQGMIDLNIKTFSSIVIPKEVIVIKDSAETNPSNKDSTANKLEKNYDDDDCIQFKSKTITSCLNEIEATVEPPYCSPSVKPLTASTTKMENDKDFTLADIFKDSPKKPDKNELENSLRKRGESYFLNKSKLIFSAPDVELPPVKMCSPIIKTAPEICQTLEESDDDRSSSSMSDVDLDQLIDNPDFLNGLEEIDRELQNAGHTESKSNVITSEHVSSSVPANIDTNPVFAGHESGNFNLELEDINSEFVNVLKMLFRLAKRLGPLGLSICALYHTATEDFKNRKDTISSLGADAKTLLILVNSKLNSLLKENLTQVQKAIFGEVSERLKALLVKLNVKYDKFSGVNVQSIASATMGQDVTRVVAFIKNTLLYHGYTEFTSEDVMNLYMSVKAAQLDLERS